MNILNSLLFAASWIIIVIALLGAVIYVFTALSLKQMGSRRGIENAWLAWIPFVGSYVAGAIADDYIYRTYGKSYHLKWIMLATSCALAFMQLVFWIPVLAQIINIASYVAFGFTYFFIYRDYSPGAYIPLTVCSVIFPVVVPFALLVLKDRMPECVRKAGPQA